MSQNIVLHIKPLFENGMMQPTNQRVNKKGNQNTNQKR